MTTTTTDWTTMHLLLGKKREGSVMVLMEWHYAPKAHEVSQRIASAEKEFDAFLLVSPCGPELPGNYQPPSAYGYPVV